jgi:uncharacterized protein DUF5670
VDQGFLTAFVVFRPSGGSGPPARGIRCALTGIGAEVQALKGVFEMLWTIFVILMVMWLLGMVTSYTLGGFIHILLVLAIVSVLISLIQGRRPV